VPEPFLQLKQTERLFRVVELRGNGGPGAMTCDPAASVIERNGCFSAQQGDDDVVDVPASGSGRGTGLGTFPG